MFQWLFKNRSIRFSWLDIVLCFLFFLGTGLIVRILRENLQSEYFYHACNAQALIGNGTVQLSWFVYLVMAFFNSFSTNSGLWTMGLGIGALGSLRYLSLCVVFKDWLIRHSLRRYSRSLLVALIPALLMILAPLPLNWLIPGLKYYAGSLPIIIWHNPVAIGGYGLALLLFYLGYRFLCDPGTKTWVVCFVLMFLNWGVMPSFILLWGAAFGVVAIGAGIAHWRRHLHADWKRLILNYMLVFAMLSGCTIMLGITYNDFFEHCKKTSQLRVESGGGTFFRTANRNGAVTALQKRQADNNSLPFAFKNPTRCFWYLVVPGAWLAGMFYPLIILAVGWFRKSPARFLLSYSVLFSLLAAVFYSLFFVSGNRMNGDDLLLPVCFAGFIAFSCAELLLVSDHIWRVSHLRRPAAWWKRIDWYFYLIHLLLIPYIYWGCVLLEATLNVRAVPLI